VKICTTCGSNHADDVDFCPYDGTPLFASASMEDDGLPEPDFHEPAPNQAGNKRLDSAQFPEVEPLIFAQPQPRVAPRLDSAEFPEVEPTLSVNNMPAVALAAEPAPEPPKPAIRQPRAVPIPPPELFPERHEAAQEDDDPGFDPNAVTPPPMPAGLTPKPSEPSVLDLLGDPVPVEDEGLDGLPGDEPLSLDDGLKDRVAPPPEAPPAPPAGSRKLLVALVVGLVVLAALGAVGYFVVLPMLQQAP
jgi:hypothetical protein